MKFFPGIVCLAASLVCLSMPASSQNVCTTSRDTPPMLRSGRSQQLTSVIDYISTDELARTLYRTLYITAGSEPSSPTEASRIAKACGFVLLAGFDTTLSPLTAMQQSSLTTHLRDLLSTMNTEVTPVVEDFQWRAVELMQYSAAYDYYRIVNERDSDIEKKLTDFANAAYNRLNQPIIVRNNHSLKLAAAIGYTALILQNNQNGAGEFPVKYFTFAYDCIEETMWGYQSDSSGFYGYSEGPYYFRYAMMSVLPFLLALDAQTDEHGLQIGDRNYPSLLRLKRWQRLFEWIAALRMPDGTLPVFEDTYAGTWFPELHILPSLYEQSSITWWNEYDKNGHLLPPVSMTAELTRTFDFRPEYLLNNKLAKVRPGEGLASFIFPDAGYAVFRDGWDTRDLYLAFIGKHGKARTHRSPMGSGHKHANETAFILSAGGENLIIEPAYHSSTMRDSLVYARNHNVLLVDGKGADSVSYGNFLYGADAYITDTMTCATGGMLRISTSYQQASIERSAYLPDSRFIVLRDQAVASRQREFTHQLHGNGLAEKGSFSYDAITRTANWYSGSMSLTARVGAVNTIPQHTPGTELHAPGYQTFARHEVLRSRVTTDHVVFHTILIPHRNTTEVHTNEIAADKHASVLTASLDESSLLSVVTADGQLSRVAHPILGPVYGNGRAWQCILDPAGRPVVWMLHEGSMIQLTGGRTLLSSAMPLSALLAYFDGGMDVTIRRATARQVSIRIPYLPQSINGKGLASWSVNGPLLQLTLSDEDSDLRIEFSSTATAVENTDMAPNVCIDPPWPNPCFASSNANAIVKINLPSGNHARLTLIDKLGRTIRVITEDLVGPSVRYQTVQTSDLTPGLYFLRLESNKTVLHRHLLVQ